MARVEALVCPRGASEIFETDADGLFAKAFMSGDVFTDILHLDDPAEPLTVAIVGHPCAIRGSGGQLKTRIPCCLVNSINKAVPYAEWADGNFDLFPLDNSLDIGTDLAIRFTEFQSVHERELLRGRRVAGLTPRGVYIFQQRFAHSLTRTGVALEAFTKQSKPIVDEAEEENFWVDELVMADLGDTPRDAALESRIAKAVKAFHKFLDEEKDGRPRRKGFEDDGGRKNIHDDLKAEIRRIKDEAADGSVRDAA